ncbi:hypothetical protein M0804_009257 [Polistes exclamans]|nr:hypothetical protein M0804_009257 [Polistes exclamans]
MFGLSKHKPKPAADTSGVATPSENTTTACRSSSNSSPLVVGGWLVVVVVARGKPLIFVTACSSKKS